MTGVIIPAPLVGTRFVPAPVKMAVAVALTVILAPLVPTLHVQSLQLAAYALLTLEQLAIGIAIGCLASLLLACAEMGGRLLDVQMGISAAQLFDPSAGEQAAVLGRMYHTIAMMVFLAVNGHHWLILGVFRSFQLVPLEQFRLSPGTFNAAFTLFWCSLEITLRIAAPGIAALFLADVTLGLIARAVPQMNVFFVGIPPKIFLGLVILALASPVIVSAISSLISDMPCYLDALLKSLR